METVIFFLAIPHGAEAVYVFGGKPIGGEYLGIELIPTEDDKFMIEFFGVVWTNFAKTGFGVLQYNLA